MIRINLLEVGSRPGPPPRIRRGMRAAMAVGGFAAAAGLVLWPALSVRSRSIRLDERLRAVDRELAALADVPSLRDEAERRGDDLARQVGLAEALQAAQGAPVRLLDAVGRVVPDGLWLTELRQQGDTVTLVGRARGMSVVSDLVARLEASGPFLPPVEIVESRLEAHAGTEAVRFELRMRFPLPSSRPGSRRLRLRLPPSQPG